MAVFFVGAEGHFRQFVAQVPLGPVVPRMVARRPREGRAMAQLEVRGALPFVEPVGMGAIAEAPPVCADTSCRRRASPSAVSGTAQFIGCRVLSKYVQCYF